MQGAEETCALRCTSQQAGVALSSALDAISEARKLRDQRSLFARKTDAGSAELYFHCALAMRALTASPLCERQHLSTDSCRPMVCASQVVTFRRLPIYLWRHLPPALHGVIWRCKAARRTAVHLAHAGLFVSAKRRG